MYNMPTQLATDEDVKLAQNAVSDCEAKIKGKEAEIAETKAMIEKLTTTIGALKSQLS
jgi:peptidoglycan hydrolase CwlO-like protein